MKKYILYLIAAISSLCYAQIERNLPTGNVRQRVAVFLEPVVDTSRVLSLREVISRQPGTAAAAGAQLAIAKIFYDGRAYGKALVELQNAIIDSLSPSLADDALYYLAHCYSLLRQDRMAVDQATKLAQRFPQSKWIDASFLVKGRSFFNLQRYEDAIRDLKTLTARSPLSTYTAEAWLLISRANRALERWSEAAIALDRLINDFPQNEQLASAYFDRGVARARLDQFDDAADDLAKAGPLLANRDDKAQAQYQLASIYFRRSQFETARVEFQKVIDLYPAETITPLAAFRVASCFMEQKKYQDALARFTAMITAYADFPHKDWLLFFSGRCYYLLGQKDEANRYFRDLISQYPNSSLRKAAEKMLKGG